jgi:hypothetical protein
MTFTFLTANTKKSIWEFYVLRVHGWMIPPTTLLFFTSLGWHACNGVHERGFGHEFNTLVVLESREWWRRAAQARNMAYMGANGGRVVLEYQWCV